MMSEPRLGFFPSPLARWLHASARAALPRHLRGYLTTSDLVSETQIRYFQYQQWLAREGNSVSNPKALLRKMIRFFVVDLMRKYPAILRSDRAPHDSPPDPPHPSAIPSPGPGSDHLVNLLDFEAFLRSLSRQDMSMLDMSIINGYSHKKIAILLRVTPNYVKTRLAWLKTQLRLALDEEDSTDDPHSSPSE